MTTDRCLLLLACILCVVCYVCAKPEAVMLKLPSRNATATGSRRQTASAAVKEGDSFELVCEADVADSPVELKHHSMPINVTSRPGTSWNTNTRRITDGKQVSVNSLRIDHVTLNDYGVYECRPEGDILDSQTMRVKLTITKPKALQVVMVTNNASHGDSHLQQNTSQLSFKCNGEYQSDPIWFVDGAQLHDGFSKDKKIMTTITVLADRDGDLRQSWMTRSADRWTQFTGHYKCVDNNHHLTDSEVWVISAAAVSSTASVSVVLLIVSVVMVTRHQLLL